MDLGQEEAKEKGLDRRSSSSQNNAAGRTGGSAAAAGTAGSVARFLTIAEEVGFIHHRQFGMRRAHVGDIGFVIGQADHQSGCLPEILAEPGKVVEQGVQALAVGIAW
jgi:hypothetical protein